jgi:hypothetical protein
MHGDTNLAVEAQPVGATEARHWSVGAVVAIACGLVLVVAAFLPG